MRSVSFAFVVLLVVSAVPAGAADGVGDGPTAERASEPAVAPDELSVETTFSLEDTDAGEIRVIKEYHVGSRVRTLGKAVDYPIEDVSTRNVRRRDGTFEWDGTGEGARIEYVAPAALLGPPGVETVRGDGYAVVGATYGGLRSDAERVTTSVSVDGAGVAGQRFAVLGGYTEYARDTATGRYRVVVPDHVTFEGNASVMLDAVERTDSRIDAGIGRDESAAYFVVDLDFGPRLLGKQFEPYGAGATGDVLVNTGSPQTAAHEAVHQLKQAYPVDRSARWTVEATAEYYSHLLLWRQGRSDFRRFANALSPVTVEEGARLAAPDTWNSRMTPYDRGSRVVSYLDARIRTATDGERTFEDVLARMNERDEPLTHAAFADIVGEVGGPELEPVVERYATTDAVPPAPSNPYVYTDPSIESNISLAPAGPNGSVQRGSGPYRQWRVTLNNTGSAASVAVGFDATLPDGWNLTGAAVAEKGVRYMKSDPVPGAEVGYFQLPAGSSTDFILSVHGPENRTAGDYEYAVSARDLSGQSATVSGTFRVGRGTDDTEPATDGPERTGSPPSSALTAAVDADDRVGTASVGDRSVPVVARGEPVNITATLRNVSYPVHSYEFDATGTAPVHSVNGTFSYTPRTRGPKTVGVTANLENGRDVDHRFRVLVNDAPRVEIDAESPGSTVTLKADVDDEYGRHEVVWLVDGERAGRGGTYRLERTETEANVTVVVRDGYGELARDSRTVAAGSTVLDDLPAVHRSIPDRYGIAGFFGLVLVGALLVRRRSG